MKLMDRTETEWLTVKEAAVLLRISLAAAYKRIDRGDIPTSRFGHSHRVPRRFCDNPTAETAAAIRAEWAAAAG